MNQKNGALSWSDPRAGAVTLLSAARDPAHNNAVALRNYLEQRAKPRHRSRLIRRSSPGNSPRSLVTDGATGQLRGARKRYPINATPLRTSHCFVQSNKMEPYSPQSTDNHQ